MVTHPRCGGQVCWLGWPCQITQEVFAAVRTAGAGAATPATLTAVTDLQFVPR